MNFHDLAELFSEVTGHIMRERYGKVVKHKVVGRYVCVSKQISNASSVLLEKCELMS